jgi:hypothetical protein
MSTHTFPTGHIHKKIGFRKASDILEKSDIENKNYILQTIKKSVPRLLLDESSILRKDFGIENSIYIIDLNKTGSGYYTLNCNMVIGGKADVVKFYNDIGFILTRKQNKLKSFLMEKDSISKKKGGKA